MLRPEPPPFRPSPVQAGGRREARTRPSRTTARLSAADLRAALDVLQAIGEAGTCHDAFARQGVACLRRLVGSELTTLSVCDLDSGHRAVVSDQPGVIAPHAIAVFDHYFHEHPLVREHGRNPCAVTRRIGDLVDTASFRRSGLYNDYYRPIRIQHAMAVPIHVDRNVLVSFVLNRSGRDFSDRDRAVLEVIRPHLGGLYRLSVAAAAAAGPAGAHAPPASGAVRAAALGLRLTAREREVVGWLGAGKTDRDIGEILGISPRTVHKHLQRIYEKLGVETRTAAVMRVLAAQRAS
jgi:DNA-binding CsgD family transcriptional regulator